MSEPCRVSLRVRAPPSQQDFAPCFPAFHSCFAMHLLRAREQTVPRRVTPVAQARTSGHGGGKFRWGNHTRRGLAGGSDRVGSRHPIRDFLVCKTKQALPPCPLREPSSIPIRPSSLFSSSSYPHSVLVTTLLLPTLLFPARTTTPSSPQPPCVCSGPMLTRTSLSRPRPPSSLTSPRSLAPMFPLRPPSLSRPR